MRWQGGGGFYPTHGIDTNSSAKIMFCLIISKLILVQNNHFSKVCTVFCLIKIIILIICSITIGLLSLKYVNIKIHLKYRKQNHFNK